jgi:hypothetical protein
MLAATPDQTSIIVYYDNTEKFTLQLILKLILLNKKIMKNYIFYHKRMTIIDFFFFIFKLVKIRK